MASSGYSCSHMAQPGLAGIAQNLQVAILRLSKIAHQVRPPIAASNYPDVKHLLSGLHVLLSGVRIRQDFPAGIPRNKAESTWLGCLPNPFTPACCTLSHWSVPVRELGGKRSAKAQFHGSGLIQQAASQSTARGALETRRPKDRRPKDSGFNSDFGIRPSFRPSDSESRSRGVPFSQLRTIASHSRNPVG